MCSMLYIYIYTCFPDSAYHDCHPNLGCVVIYIYIYIHIHVNTQIGCIEIPMVEICVRS